jgi:hypothetical protein
MTGAVLESLDGWELVDAIDGRRWLGRIVARGPEADPRQVDLAGAPEEVRVLFLSTLPDYVRMQPAFEILPQVHGLILGQKPPNLAQLRGELAPEIAPVWLVSPARSIVGVLQLRSLPAYTCQRAGGFQCASLEPSAQRDLLAELNKTIAAMQQAEANEKKMERARG